jgi:uncharacterized protein YggE
MKLVVLSMLAAAAFASAGCGGGDVRPEAAVARNPGGDAAVSSASPLPFGGTVAGTAGITVVGTGTVDVVPDVADWSFGVSSQAATATAALSANSAAMKDMLDALRGAGIAKEDMRTDQVSVYPQMSNDGRSVTGYSASNTVTATIRNLGKAGAVVDAAVRAGANDVYGPSLRPSDSDAQYREAVDKAYDDARGRAEAIAAKAGVALGSPVAIAEGGGSVPGPVYDGVRAAAGAAEVAPVEPGKQQVTAYLTVTFAIGA